MVLYLLQVLLKLSQLRGAYMIIRNFSVVTQGSIPTSTLLVNAEFNGWYLSSRLLFAWAIQLYQKALARILKFF